VGRESKIRIRRVIRILFCLCLAVHVTAQEVEAPRWFKLTDLSGSLSLRYQLTDEKETFEETISRDSARKFLEGGLRLYTKGSIYHPNLFSFSASVNLVGHRQKVRIFTDPSSNNDLNNTYDIHLYLLKKKKINFDFYTLRNFNSKDRAFLERYFTTQSRTGFIIRNATKWLPLEVDVYSSRIKTESPTFKERDETSKNADFRINLLKRTRSRGVLTGRFKDFDESVYDVQYKSWDIFGNFLHNYGIKERNVLTSTLTYQRLSGFYNLETFVARANNIYYWKPNLFSNANYTFMRDNSFNRSFRRHQFYVDVNHQLFLSLRTQLRVGGRLEDAEDRKNTAFNRHITFDYNKKIPTGSIRLNFNNQRERVNYVSRLDVTENSEIFDFSLTDSIILTTPGIDKDSLRLTAPDLSRIYLEGVDYQVDELNGQIIITRLPGGAITAEAKVLVFYRFLSYPDYRLNSNLYSYGAQLNFLNYFYVLYSRNKSSQTITSDYLIPPFEEFNKNVLGGGFAWRALKSRYTYETYKSTLNDYVLHNFVLSGNVSLFRKLRFSAHMSINNLTYKPEIFFSRFNAYNLEFSYTPSSDLNFDALYRKFDYASPNYENIRESLLFKLRLKFRSIILEAFYERLLSTTQMTERGHNFFSIVIRREF
jgi:hypothetical protein